VGAALVLVRAFPYHLRQFAPGKRQLILYQDTVAVYSILDGAVLAGELPPNKHKLVVAWIEIHQEDLLTDWGLAADGKKPFPIRGLDQ
jgi:hypothetical protein